jgi:hypothetical protein
MWDDEVDVVCAGSGVAALAIAVSAVDADLDVYVARAAVAGEPADVLEPRRSWFGRDFADAATSDYFTSLAADLGTPSWSPSASLLDVRPVEEEPPAHLRSAVETFFGSRLREWAVRCLTSPYGFVSTRVPERMTTMRTGSGRPIQVDVLGSIDPVGGLLTDGVIREWLASHAQERQINVVDSSSLTRLVFEEGGVTGAVFETPDGPYAVRARHGVTVAPGQPPAVNDPGASAPAGGDGPVRVCLVGETASRFGRIELLTTRPATTGSQAMCGAANRRSRENRRDQRATRSQSRRRREVHGHPPIGQ